MTSPESTAESMAQSSPPQPQGPTTPGRRRRWPRRILLTAVCAICLALLLLAALLFTSLGGFALRTVAGSLAPEGLDLSALRGSPVGGLESTPFAFRGDGLDLRCEQLSVALSPAPLTRGAARLRATARDCELRLTGGASEPADAPLQLPTLRLPRPLALAPLEVENLRIFQDDSELAALHGLQLGAHLRGSRLSLQQLTADGSLDTLRWSLRLPESGQGGELTLDGSWPLDLALDWRVESPELPPVDGQSRFSGSLQQLEAELDFRSAAASTLAGSLTGRGSPLDLQQPFDLRLNVESADLGALRAAETAENDEQASPQAAFLEGVLRGQLEAQGEGGEAGFQGDLVLTPTVVARADGSSAGPPPLQLKLRGLASAEAVTVEALTASWDEGEIQGQGTLTLQDSNPADSDAQPLQADSFDVANQPLPRLDASLSVRGFDPQRFLPQAPPGALDLRAVAVDWSLDSQNPRGRIQLESLSGTLQGQPVEGQGEALLSAERWLIQPSRLRWGGALAEASGNLEEGKWDLLWSVAAPDLDSLDPRLEGTFSASGTLQGPRDAPRWRAQLRSQGLQLPGLTAQELRGDVDLVHSPTGRAEAQLTLRQVTLGQGAQGEVLEISTASLRSAGRVNDHRLSLEALVPNPSEAGTASSIELALLAEGAWGQSEGASAPDGATSRWSGRLLELALNPRANSDSADSASMPSTELPTVSLQEASEATFASDGSWQLGETCLAVGDGQLCMTGEQQAEGALDAALQLRQLPLQWVRRWLPQELTLHGTLDGSGALRGQFGNAGGWVDTADLELNLVAGELEWSGQDDDLQDASGNALSNSETESGIENLRWPITAATLTARRQPGAGPAEPGSVVADLSLDLGPKGRLTAHGELAEPAGTTPWTSSSLRASLRGELHDFLPWVAALDPLDSLEGNLHLDLAADGSLGSPRWAGEMRFDNGQGRVETGSPAQGGVASSLLLSPLQARLELLPDGARLVALAEAPDSGLLLDLGAQLQQPTPSDEDPSGDDPSNAASSSSWLDETLNAPLQGRLMTRIPDLGSVEGLLPELRELSGSARSEVFLGGSLRQPELRGSAQLRRGRAQLPLLGITLSGADLDLELQGPQQLTLSGQVSSGGGRLQLNGTAWRAEEGSEAGAGALIQVTSDPPVSTQDTADQAPASSSPGFQLVDLPEAKIWGHPDLEITVNRDGLAVEGELTVPKARFDLDRVPPTVPISDDVVFVTAGSTAGPQRLPIRSEVRLVLGEDVRVQGAGARSRLEGELDIREDPGRAMLAAGEVTLHEGRVAVAGQRLEVDRGRLLFTGGPADNPGLDLEISRSRRGGDVRATLRILGTANEPLLQLFTDPPSSEEDALAYLLFGAPLSQTSSGDRDLVDRTLTSAGLSLSGAIAKRLGDRLGIDETQVEAASGQESATLFFGEYLSPRLFVAYGIGLLEPVSTFRLRYTLSDLWELRAESGSESSVDLSYRVGTSKTP